MKNLVVVSFVRGHKIVYDEKAKEWLWQEDKSDMSNEKPCKKCGRLPTTNGVDYCLRELEQTDFIVSACCGHSVEKGYIMLKDGRMFKEVIDDE